jgi:hypothetical protein
MDSKLSPAQAGPHRDGDVVVLGPKDWTDAEEALSKLAHVASDRRRLPAELSAGPRATEPSLGPTLRPTDLNNDPLPTDRPSLDKRTLRSLARFLLAAGVGVAATLAWQSYGGPAKQMIANAVPQLGWLLSPPAMDPPSEIAVEQPSPPAVQASAPKATSAQAGAVAPTASETAASTAPAAPSPELQQQLETMMHDLAAVRQSVEQLAAGQEQMARDIAKLQTAGQQTPGHDIRRGISALPPAAATTARKPVSLPQAAPQSSTTPLPPEPPEPAAQSAVEPLQPPPPRPPRPPMPVR